MNTPMRRQPRARALSRRTYAAKRPRVRSPRKVGYTRHPTGLGVSVGSDTSKAWIRVTLCVRRKILNRLLVTLVTSPLLVMLVQVILGYSS